MTRLSAGNDGSVSHSRTAAKVRQPAGSLPKPPLPAMVNSRDHTADQSSSRRAVRPATTMVPAERSRRSPRVTLAAVPLQSKTASRPRSSTGSSSPADRLRRAPTNSAVLSTSCPGLPRHTRAAPSSSRAMPMLRSSTARCAGSLRRRRPPRWGPRASTMTVMSTSGWRRRSAATTSLVVVPEPITATASPRRLQRSTAWMAEARDTPRTPRWSEMPSAGMSISSWASTPSDHPPPPASPPSAPGRAGSAVAVLAELRPHQPRSARRWGSRGSGSRRWARPARAGPPAPSGCR